MYLYLISTCTLNNINRYSDGKCLTDDVILRVDKPSGSRAVFYHDAGERTCDLDFQTHVIRCMVFVNYVCSFCDGGTYPRYATVVVFGVLLSQL